MADVAKMPYPDKDNSFTDNDIDILIFHMFCRLEEKYFFFYKLNDLSLIRSFRGTELKNAALSQIWSLLLFGTFLSKSPTYSNQMWNTEA